MRKIDDKTHQRFITALESLIRDIDSLGYSDRADQLVISRDELEEVYLKYRRKMEEVYKLIHSYQELFEATHSEYISASRFRQKEQTRIRRIF